MRGPEALGDDRDLGVRVADLVALVQYDIVPVLCDQIAVVDQKALIGCDEDSVRLKRLVYELLFAFFSTGAFRVDNEYFEKLAFFFLLHEWV